MNICLFQRVRFHRILRSTICNKCSNCTQPQMIDWSHFFYFSQRRDSYLIALPGKLETIVTQSGQNTTLCVEWIKQTKLDFDTEKLCRDKCETDVFDFSCFSDLLPQFSGFNQHSFHVTVKEKVYHFFKYMDNSYNWKYYKFERVFYGPKKKGRWTKKPDYTCYDHIHKPKLFSWSQVKKSCEMLNSSSSLPEFLSMSEQDEFVNILKNSEKIFPMEAIFVGVKLLEANKVSCLKSVILSFLCGGSHKMITKYSPN